jgi:ribosomal protein S12 methylthiotransferase accessory factor
VSTTHTQESVDDVASVEEYLGARRGAGAAPLDVSVLGARYVHGSPGRRSVAADAPYVAVRLSHTSALVSRFTPGARPCPTCLERRWLALRPMPERRVIEDGRPRFKHGRNPWLTPFALEALGHIVETASVPAAGDGATHEVFVLNLETLRTGKHQLIPDSLCPDCARRAPDSAEGAAVTLSPRLKRSPTSYRLRDVNSLDLRVPAFVNPACGALGARSYSDYAHVLTAPVTGQFQTRGTRGEHPVWWSGHGNNYRESLTVALLEGLERHAGIVPRKKDPAVFDSYANLKEHALDPAAVGLYEPAFYDSHPHFTPYTPDLKFYWVWGYSLTQSRPVLVPAQMVYYTDYTRQQPLFVQDCSNGCAIGSCLEEAILSGLMELVERDSFLISWHAALSLPHIDPWSSRSRETLFVLDRIERMGCEVRLLDMRLDLGIPAVMGVTRRRDRELGALVFAAGSSFDPERAVRGALCEIASYVSDFQRRVAAEEEKVRAMMRDYRRVEKLGDHALLYGLPEMADRVGFLFESPVSRGVEETYRDWERERPRGLDLRDDIGFCIERLASAGLEQVIVVDQTSPEQERLGLSTACVIVPGLLPMDFGHGHDRTRGLRRLYTAPRAAGFRAADLTPADLNPHPHPFP